MHVICAFVFDDTLPIPLTYGGSSVTQYLYKGSIPKVLAHPALRGPVCACLNISSLHRLLNVLFILNAQATLVADGNLNFAPAASYTVAFSGEVQNLQMQYAGAGMNPLAFFTAHKDDLKRALM